MTTAPAKFLFDTNLEAPAAPPPVAFNEVEQLKALHAQELTRVKQEALEMGRQEGRLETEQSIERELYNSIDQLIQNAQILQADIDEKVQSTRTSSLLLAQSVARKLAGPLLAQYPSEQIESFFNQSLSFLPDKTALRLHVPPQLAGALQPRLEAALERNGHENLLTIVEDDSNEGINCQLVWADGGIEQSTDKIYAQIENMIASFLNTDIPSIQSVPVAQTESLS